MVTGRGDCHTVQGPWKKPTVEGLPLGMGCCRGPKVDLGMNTGCRRKGKQPPPCHFWARLLLALASEGAAGRGSRKLTCRGHVVSVQCEAHLAIVARMGEPRPVH